MARAQQRHPGGFGSLSRQLAEEQRDAVWGLVDDWSQAESEDHDKAALREQVRRFALSPYGRQELPVKMREKARAAYSQLAPRDSVARHAWLFGRDWVGIEADDFTDGNPDYEKHEARVSALRTESMAEIWAEHEIAGAIALIANGADARLVGSFAARSVSGTDAAVAVLGDCLSVDTLSENSVNDLIRGFLWATDERERPSLLSGALELVPADQKARLLCCAPVDDKTWEILERQPPTSAASIGATFSPTCGGIALQKSMR